MKTTEKQASLHLGIAERGKMYALEGNHKEALRYYRESLNMAIKQQAPELFAQHYTQCIMESLELSGAYDEVISYCERAEDFLSVKPETEEHVRRMRAQVLEKCGVQLVLKGASKEAAEVFRRAQELSGRGKQPLTDDLLNWTQRGYVISVQQLRQAQQKHKYFTVRKETVRPEMAVELPPAVSPF